MARCTIEIDPLDPRAPSEEVWATLTEVERARVIAQLPDEVPESLFMPEGDEHRSAKDEALDELGHYFRSLGRSVYLSSEINVYYPNEPRFAPDVLAVFDVVPHKRGKWVVDLEKRGLDFVLEVMVTSQEKDLKTNVDRYARLGIPEYFVLDRVRRRLHGFRLPSPQSRQYERVVPQDGRWHSAVMGLSLGFELDKLRFFSGSAFLPGSLELLDRANRAMTEAMRRHEAVDGALVDALRELEEQRQQREEQRQQLEEQRQLAATAEAKIRELEAELARIRPENT